MTVQSHSDARFASDEVDGEMKIMKTLQMMRVLIMALFVSVVESNAVFL